MIDYFCCITSRWRICHSRLDVSIAGERLQKQRGIFIMPYTWCDVGLSFLWSYQTDQRATPFFRRYNSDRVERDSSLEPLYQFQPNIITWINTSIGIYCNQSYHKACLVTGIQIFLYNSNKCPVLQQVWHDKDPSRLKGCISKGLNIAALKRQWWRLFMILWINPRTGQKTIFN